MFDEVATLCASKAVNMPKRVTEGDDDAIACGSVLLESEFAAVTDDLVGG